MCCNNRYYKIIMEHSVLDKYISCDIAKIIGDYYNVIENKDIIANNNSFYKFIKNEHRYEMLECYANNDNLDMFINICEKHDVTRDEIFKRNKILHIISIKGYLDILEWINIKYKLTKDIVMSKYVQKNIFYNACNSGNLELLNWLYTTFDISQDDIVNIYDNDLFRMCNMKTFIWLHETFNIPKEFIVKYFYFYDLSELKWLHITYKLTKNDIYEHLQDMFTAAAEDNDFDKLIFLNDAFMNNLYDDIMISAYKEASRYGRLNVLKWLQKTFNIPKKDVMHDCNEAVWFASKNGDIEMLQWMHDTFNFTKKEIVCVANDIFNIAVTNGNLDVLKWLHNIYNFTNDDIYYDCFDYELDAHPDIIEWLRITYNYKYYDSDSETE